MENMVESSQFTERPSRGICAGHLIFSLILGVLVLLGYDYSGKERGENKTPYYFTAGVLCGFHVVFMFLSVFVIYCTRSQKLFDRRKSSLRKVQVLYIIGLNVAMAWCFIGLIITCIYGCCQGKRCYAQTNETDNIIIAVVIAIMHFLTFFWFIKLNPRIREIHNLYSKSLTVENNKRIQIESDSEDDENIKQNTRNAALGTKPLEKHVVETNTFSFAVFAKSISKFMHARPVNKISQTSNIDNGDQQKSQKK